MSSIIYTHTDEAPLLATYSFLPIVQAYAAKAGVDVETRDISVAARILAQFGLADDALGELGALAKTPGGQHRQAAERLRVGPAAQGRDQGAAGARASTSRTTRRRPTTDEEKEVRAKYDKVKGSAVNPVLREGNSDRRAPASVKNYAKTHPHTNKPFAEGSKTNVATMGDARLRVATRSR